MTKQERAKLAADYRLIRQFALEYQTLKREYEERMKVVLQLEAEARRLDREAGKVEERLKQMQTDFGLLLAEFTFDFGDSEEPKRLLRH
jgi:phosphoribosylaminoimidazole-succinocarboxamide synthase